MHRGHRHVDFAVGERVARSTIDTKQRDDVACRGVIDILHLVRMHSNESADLDLLARSHVVDRVALLERSLIDTHIGQLTIATVLELEREEHEGLRIVGEDFDLGLVLVEIDRHVVHLGRVGEIAGHCVQQQLNPLVLVRRPHKDRRQLHRERAVPNGVLDHLRLDLLFEHRFHQLVGEHRNRIEHDLAILVGLCLKIGGNLLFADILAVVTIEVECLHRHQVDDTFEIVLEADRQLHHDRIMSELVAKLAADLEGIGARTVELVDESDARDLVPLHLAIHRHRLRLHAGDTTEDQDRTVEHAKRSLDLDCEVDVAGRIDDVDLMIVPHAVGRSGGDRDAALALEFHRVHCRADFVLAADFVDRVNLSRIEEDALRQGRLA